MGLLNSSSTIMPHSELAGRLAILQCACAKLHRYKWSIVRSFHTAALQRALCKPGSWSAEWTDLKVIYFDLDPTHLKASSATYSQGPVEKPKSSRLCWAFNENKYDVTFCRFEHVCNFCWNKLSKKYRHSETGCERKKTDSKQATGITD
uniref:Uncharacterized protein n=1 Tax=Branchiostoma floridae TaxID=7739 RepID=C3Z862_BRAFL|eukprot:XP_002595174.1 hypothetical protein BRAFLDRAFT_101679 [Branchiostoma floridae]